MQRSGPLEHSGERAPWWRDARQRNRVLLVTFAMLALGGILFTAFTNYLFAGDQRVVRVTMVQDSGQAVREGLKRACGNLPGVKVVPDKGNPDPRIQGRFPVRFAISDITQGQLGALYGCIDRQPGILGTITENDGT